LVAITAAVISFSHVRALALRAGETELTSWLLPISIDGAVVAAVSVLLADSRAGRRPALLTWLLLTLGLAASLASNVASAEPTTTARAVAAWPPLALALGIEVLAGLARRTRLPDAETAAGLQPWPGLAESNVPGGNGNGSIANGRVADGIARALPVRQSANGNGRSARRQPALDDDSAVKVIRDLDARSPERRASRLEIQTRFAAAGRVLLVSRTWPVSLRPSSPARSRPRPAVPSRSGAKSVAAHGCTIQSPDPTLGSTDDAAQQLTRVGVQIAFLMARPEDREEATHLLHRRCVRSLSAAQGADRRVSGVQVC